MKLMSLHLSALLLLLWTVGLINAQASPSKAEAVINQNETLATNVSDTTKDPRLTGDPRHDYIYDPNLPRELNGYDLINYPFYTSIPTDITFKCDGRIDGYYASIKHHCQLFHLCSHSHRHDFLCANYTVFDQTQFICHFVNSVNCSKSELYYDRNNELYVTTTTTELPEYEDEYADEPRTKRPRRRKNKRRQKLRRRTTTPPPEDYYDDYEDDSLGALEYEEELPEEPKPAPKRTRTRTTTAAPTEEPTARPNVPKVRRPQPRAPKPLMQPPTSSQERESVAGLEDPNVDAAVAAEVPVVADELAGPIVRRTQASQSEQNERTRRPLRGSSAAVSEDTQSNRRSSRGPRPTASDDEPAVERPSRGPRPTASDDEPAVERPSRGPRPSPPSDDPEPVRRPLRERRPVLEESEPVQNSRGLLHSSSDIVPSRASSDVVPSRPSSRREQLSASGDGTKVQQPTHRQSSSVRDEIEPVQRPLRQPPARQVAQNSAPPTSPPLTDPSSIIAGILSGAGAIPPPPPPPPPPEIESEPILLIGNIESGGRRPDPSSSEDAVAPAPAENAPATNGKRRVVQRRRKTKKPTTTTTTTTTAPLQDGEYEYDYIIE